MPLHSSSPIDPEAVIIPISETQAVILESHDTGAVAPSASGQRLTVTEVSRLATALHSASDAYITAQKAAGRLVEIDPQTRALIKQAATTVTDEGDWIQGTVRNAQGQIIRIMRVRPASGAALLSPATAALGSVAAQAQTADMAKDIKQILAVVGQLQEAAANDRHGHVKSIVNEVAHHVRITREHGDTEISDAAIATLRLQANQLHEANIRDLRDAVGQLEKKKRKLPTGAQKDLKDNQVQPVQVCLQHASLLYSSSAQLYALETARLLAQGKPQVAKTHLAELIEWRDQVATQLQKQMDRLSALDQHTRGLSKPAWRRMLFVPAGAPGGAGVGVVAAGRFAPAVAGVGARALMAGPMLAATAVGGVHAFRQNRAEGNVAGQLDKLVDSVDQSADIVQQVIDASSALHASTRSIVSTETQAGGAANAR